MCTTIGNNHHLKQPLQWRRMSAIPLAKDQ